MLLRFYITFIFTISVGIQFSSAQCSCTDCPVNTISNGTVSSTLNINGATNPTMGANGQDLGEICIDYFTDAVNEIDMTLTAPNGTSVLLIQQTGISVNSNLDFQICFVPCSCPAQPDPGFSDIFDSDEDWVNGPPYEGTYYPSVGCLEDLNGPVDGNWTITIQDFISLDNGTLNNWTLSFVDNGGLPCTATTNCIPEICLADGGEISEPILTYCEGDPALDFNITVSYPNGSAPSSTEYGYTFIVSDWLTGEILEYTDDPDLSTYSAGNYQICGLSYLITDLPLIPSPNGVYSMEDLTMDIINEVFCADIANGCFNSIIQTAEEVVLVGPTSVCLNELYTYSIENYDPEIEYEFSIFLGPDSQIDAEASPPDFSILWILGTTAELCVEASGFCGTSIDCIDIVVEPNVELEIDGATTLCTDEIYTYTINPSLEIDESWNININGGVVIDQTENTVVVAWDFNNFDEGELCVFKEGGLCPSSETCIEVIFAIAEIPDDFITPQNLCIGDQDISFVMSDPNIVSYNWVLGNLIEIAGNGTPSIQYTTDQIGIGTICLELTNLCDESFIICKDIIVSESPDIEIIAENQVCNLSFDLFAQVDPQAEVSWAQISNPNALFFTQANNIFTSVFANVSGTYDIELTVELNGCISTEVITIQCSEPLVLDSFDEVCFDGSNYNVFFSISGGTSPFFVNGVEISGNDFSSVDFASGDNYSFFITDSGVCEISIEDSYNCDCISENGTLEEIVIVACAQEGSEVAVAQVGTPVLDIDDTAVFVLHDAPNLFAGNIIDINQTGIFIFNNSYNPDQAYYITHVVGNGIGTNIDLNDPCLATSISIAVIFLSPPSVDPPSELLSCENELIFNFENIQNTNEINWNFIEGDGTATIDVNGFESTFEIDGFGKFTFEYELTNDACQITGLLDIFVSDPMSVFNSTFNCESNGSTYDLNIEIAGGIAPFTLEGPGIITDNIITADNLTDTEIYSFNVIDSLGCSFEFDFGPVQCDCEKDLGSIISDSIFLCSGELLDPTIISLQDYILEVGADTLVYFIYEDPNTTIDQFITTSDGALIDQNPLFNTNQNYYIRLIIGAIDLDTNGIDFNDNCLQVSEPVPFIWLNDYAFFTDVHPTVCSADDFYSWLQLFPGPFPYSLTFSTAQGPDVTINIVDSEQEITLPVYPGATAWIITEADVPCAWTFEGNLTITALDEEIVALIPFDTICNTNIGGSTVILEELVQNNISGNWFLNGDLQGEDLLDFEGFPLGDYELTFSTIGFEAPCPGSETSFNFYVKECLCPIVEIADISICDDQENINIADIVPEGDYIFDIININGLINPVELIGQEIIIQNKSAGSYEMVYELIAGVDTFCPSTFTANLFLEAKNLAGTADMNINFCADEETSINLASYLNDANQNGNWYFNSNPIESMIDNSVLELGDNNFMYITEAGQYCLSDSASLSIEKINNPSANLISTDALCFGDENGTLEIEIFSDDYGPYTCIINNEENSEKLLDNLAPGAYQVIVTNDFGCTSELDPIIINEPGIVTVNLGDDQAVAFNEELTIEALVNILTSDISDITWTDLSGEINEDDLVLIQNAIENNTFQILITDENGCVAIDSINIRLLDSDIQLANIINLNSSFPMNTRFGIPDIGSIVKINSFQIYDRWGEQVFNQEDVLPGSEEVFWDGSFNGKEVQQGVYAYYLSYEDFLGKTKILVGDVTVIK